MIGGPIDTGLSPVKSPLKKGHNLVDLGIRFMSVDVGGKSDELLATPPRTSITELSGLDDVNVNTPVTPTLGYNDDYDKWKGRYWQLKGGDDGANDSPTLETAIGSSGIQE